MFKKNKFKKKLDNLVISITKRIESFFNFFKQNFSYKKNFLKKYKILYKKIFFTIVAVFFLVISYFLIPAFYDENKIKAKLEKQIFNQYNLKVKFNKSLSYGLFPKPHFYAKNTIINYKSEEVAKSNYTKILVSVEDFFSLDEIQIKNLIFKKTDFKIDKTNFNFFIDLLNPNKSSYYINFLNSKFFYVDKNDDVIFLINIKNLDYLYQDPSIQKLYSKLNIFNIPISLDVKHDYNEKKFLSELKSHPLRLQIENKSIYDDGILDGLINFNIINKSKKMNYSFENDFLKWNSIDNKIVGEIYVKPFFLSSNLRFLQIDLKNFFKDDSIFVNILKSEILNNKNLNGKISVSTDSFKGVKFLNKIKFTILLEEGNIYIQNLKLAFNKSVNVNLEDSQLIVDGNKIKFSGFVTFNFIDLDDFYRQYQINKNYRKQIKKISFGYFFDLNEKFIEIDNVSIDGAPNQNINRFLDKLNSKKENIFNKIIFKNSIKNFFKNL